jgi:hypothetical protein
MANDLEDGRMVVDIKRKVFKSLCGGKVSDRPYIHPERYWKQIVYESNRIMDSR